MVCIMYMDVNKRVELAQRGTAQKKIYVLLFIIIIIRQVCASHKSTGRLIPSEASEVTTPSYTVIYIYFSSTRELSLLSVGQRQGSPNWSNIPRTC